MANASALSARDRRRTKSYPDYSGRSGFPRRPDQMRGAALKDFRPPEDMRAELTRTAQPQAEPNL